MDSTTSCRRTIQQPVADSELPLLDIFKAAAMSVSKLYTTSLSAQSRVRAEGFQECLDQLVAFLERERMTFREEDAAKLRRWIMDRQNGGRDSRSSPQPDAGDSEEDESDGSRQPEPVTSSPERQPRPHSQLPPLPQPQQSQLDPVSSPMIEVSMVPSPVQSPTVHFAPPSLDTFSFQSTHPYPDIGDLDLSDSRGSGSTPPPPKRARNNGFRNARAATGLGKGAGHKRKLNFGEIFGLGNFGGRDVFGPGNKRGRHT